ncbi:MAG: hypothetical protein OCD03_07585 [Hyphomicrobiales bacterium]
MTTNITIIMFSLIAGIILFLPRLTRNILWSATITPLASIIGSGFLILGPILIQNFGMYAPVVMAVLCLVGFLFGSAIRYNIKAREIANQQNIVQWLEQISSWVLAFAYIVSVAYYLNLFGAFGARLVSLTDTNHAQFLTSAIFIVILIVGWSKGFSALERLEQITVSLKISIIVGLIVGLILFNLNQISAKELVLTPSKPFNWSLITLTFGLIVTIQGFETSRYLGQKYSAKTRIQSMRLAQYIASLIYIIYIVLIAYMFKPTDFGFSETAIIDMMVVVSPILPAMLIAAALSAQFSAALADTGGSGGLIEELSHSRITQKQAYLLLVLVGLALTWSVNIFGIISYASRAFALYYALQAAIAAVYAYKSQSNKYRLLLYISLSSLGFIIAIFGTSVEM